MNFSLTRVFTEVVSTHQKFNLCAHHCDAVPSVVGGTDAAQLSHILFFKVLLGQCPGNKQEEWTDHTIFSMPTCAVALFEMGD